MIRVNPIATNSVREMAASFMMPPSFPRDLLPPDAQTVAAAAANAAAVRMARR
jgi:hypothetical protein